MNEMATRTENDILAPIRATVVRHFAVIAGGSVLFLLLTSPWRGEPPAVMFCYAGLLVVFAAALAVHQSNLRLAGALCSMGPFVLVTLLVGLRGGIVHPAGTVAYITLVATTGLCWSSGGALGIAMLGSATLGWFVANGPSDVPYSKPQVWLELTVQLLVLFMLVHFALLTLRNNARNVLSHQARFRDAIESSPEAVILLNAAGIVQMFNREAARMSGLTVARANGKSLTDLNWLTPQTIAQVESMIQSVASGESVTPAEVTSHSGEALEVSVSLVTRADSDPDRLLTFREITARRAAEQAREALEARIAQSKSIEALGRLAGGVAHDFNNMLTIIKGSVELLQLDATRSALEREDLDRIGEAAARAAELTSQLLAFGRKQVLQPKLLSLNDTLRVLEPLVRRVVPSNIHLSLRLDPQLGNTWLDEARIEQVVINLVSNACDAMPSGGELTVETSNHTFAADYGAANPDVVSGDYVCIAVSDTGEGMTAETHERIFEPFFTTKARRGGTGLGLATVHGIVAQSGGQIVVDTAPGEGCRFRLYFPRKAGKAEAVARPVVEAVERTPHTRILLVEDQPAVRTSTRRMLEALGHTVEEAENGKDVLSRYEHRIEDFDLLVSDVVMPEMGGSELAQYLSERSPRLKILLMSGYSETSIRDSGVLQRNAHFLPKPFDRRSLAHAIASLCAEPLSAAIAS